MKVQIEVFYNKKDVESLVMENHIKLYGEAPKGMMWQTMRDYSWEYSIKAVEIEKPEEKQETTQKAEAV